MQGRASARPNLQSPKSMTNPKRFNAIYILPNLFTAAVFLAVRVLMFRRHEERGSQRMENNYR